MCVSRMTAIVVGCTWAVKAVNGFYKQLVSRHQKLYHSLDLLHLLRAIISASHYQWINTTYELERRLDQGYWRLNWLLQQRNECHVVVGHSVCTNVIRQVESEHSTIHNTNHDPLAKHCFVRVHFIVWYCALLVDCDCAAMPSWCLWYATALLRNTSDRLCCSYHSKAVSFFQKLYLDVASGNGPRFLNTYKTILVSAIKFADLRFHTTTNNHPWILEIWQEQL